MAAATAAHHPGQEVLFRPVRAGNAFEETVERLLQIIRLGVVPPGERLPSERDLAGSLRVSRVTLREAIRALQSAHYVDVRRGRYGGTFVADLPKRRTRRSADQLKKLLSRMGGDLEDIFALRYVVETGAAELAAMRALSGRGESSLREALRRCEEADLSTYRRLDSQLHLAIAEATGAPSLVAAAIDARQRINDLLDAIPLLERNLAHSNEQHRRMVAAILSGRPTAARHATAEHVDGTAALLRGFLG